MQPIDHLGQYCPAQIYPAHPWIIRRNDKECARARTRHEADRIIRQLQKIHRNAVFTTQYAGATISHCGDGGRAL